MTSTRWIPLFVCLLSAHLVCAEESTVGTSLYMRQGNLQQTMLAARLRYTQWLSDQPAARAAVELGPWLVTPPMSATAADKLVWRGERIDPAAVDDDGRAVWTEQKGLIDDRSSKFLAGSSGTVAYLTRTIRAAEPARLTIGVGGGDHLDLWLNGHKIASANTHLVSGRYGCSERVDGTRIDQLLVDLDLRAGVNELVVRLSLGSEPSFYFSAAPDPTAWLWKQLRHDFPPQQNPLFSWVHASWFEKDGWLAAQGHEWEQQLADQLLPACGDEVPSLQAEWDQLNGSALSDRDDPRWLDWCVKASTLGHAAQRGHAVAFSRE